MTNQPGFAQYKEYHDQILEHIQDALKKIGDYLRLRDEEKDLRRAIKAETAGPDGPGALQVVQNDLRSLAVQFFKWGFGPDDLRQIPSLSQVEMKELILTKVAIHGLPGQRQSGQGLDDLPFQSALEVVRKFVKQEKSGYRRPPEATGGGVITPPPPARQDPSQEEGVITPPSARLLAYMAVETIVFDVLRELKTATYPWCIRDGWRIYGIPQGRVIAEVELDYTPSGEPVRYFCSVWSGSGDEYHTGTSQTAARESLAATFARLHLDHQDSFWNLPLRLPEGWGTEG